jgi:hypothetical protein
MRQAAGMPKVTIEVSEELAKLLLQAEAKLKENALAAKTDGILDVKGTFEAIDAVGTGLKVEMKRRALQALDIDRARIFVEGKEHARVGRYEAEYFTKEGPVKITRSLYRECGRRNAKTVDAVSLRSGALNGWMPDATKAVAFLLQQGTSREAEATGRALGVLPYSRSSIERVAHQVASLHAAMRDEVETKLIEAYAIPARARSLSVSLDRVAVPMEEPRPRPVGRPKKGAAKRPVERVWHMAFVGTLTLHDANGESLHTIRYGRMPALGAKELLDSMLADTRVLLTKRKLEVVLLCDGAKELVDLLDGVFNTDSLGCIAHRLVDFWHVAEKLGAAASVIFGARSSAVIQRWKALLLNSEGAKNHILRELDASGMRDVRIGDECPVHAAITYLQNQGERMGYVAARKLGLPIGSGNVEATCKSLIGQRLVRTGARWKEDTGQHVIDLRALALSERFDAALDLTVAPLVRHVSRAA